MPRLAAAYTPKRLPGPFPGIKRQLGETYLEHRLGETHLEHECRRTSASRSESISQQADQSQVKLSSLSSSLGTLTKSQ